MRYAYSEDWAELARYHNENMTLVKSASRERRVVLMGDSITEFWSDINPLFFIDKPYINRGISGQTTAQMLLRFRQDVIKLEPDVVVILGGINDIAENTGATTIEQITDNIFTMIELAKVHDIAVILCSVLPANKFNWNPEIRPTDKVIELNKRLRNYAVENNIPFLDYYSRMVDSFKGLRKEYGEDGVHPNGTGYQVMQPLLEKAIEKKSL